MSRTPSPKKRMTAAVYLLASIAAGALLLSGCSSPAPGSKTGTVAPVSTESFMAEHQLDGLDARQVIDRLDALPVAERPKNLMASVRPDQLMLTDDQKRQVTLPISNEDFYLSFAPFRAQTHDCHFHSLTTCLGEMQNERVTVSVIDAASGEKIVDQTMTTFDNGFVGLWLPKGIEATLTVEAAGKKASAPISTASNESATCLTTLQLT